jgi:UPF0755 protein
LEGTYEINSGMNGIDVAQRLLSKQPLKQNVLIREGLWMSRVADLLAEKNVCDKESALTAFSMPKSFEAIAGFPLPDDSLEGYLFPDTYDLPPLFGADRAIAKMLDAFRVKVWAPLGKPDGTKLREWVIVGSMIELESLQHVSYSRSSTWAHLFAGLRLDSRCRKS